MSSGQLSKIIFLYLAKQVIKSLILCRSEFHILILNKINVIIVYVYLISTRKFIVNIPVRKPLIEEVFVKSC